MKDFLNQEYYGNPILLYLTAAGVFIIAVIAIKIFKVIVIRRLKAWSEKTETKIDDFIIRGAEKTLVPLLYFTAFYASLNILKLHPKVFAAFNIAAVIIVTFFIVRLIINLLRYLLHVYLLRKGGEDKKEKQLNGVMVLVNLLLWGIAVVFLLDNMGFKISAVVAGLGIGGIAIALAAQAVLGDLFSYFVIFFDRPFEIGDFIIVGDKMGAVEYIGLKTTRIRSLSGEQLIFSNTDLTSSRIHNYKRMERRRVVFKFGINYSTPIEVIADIPKIIRSLIESFPDTSFDRSHFTAYGSFSLDFENVYYVNSPDYNRYMDIQQEINLKLLDEFKKRNIEFAYPTHVVHLEKKDEAGS